MTAPSTHRVTELLLAWLEGEQVSTITIGAASHPIEASSGEERAGVLAAVPCFRSKAYCGGRPATSYRKASTASIAFFWCWL